MFKLIYLLCQLYIPGIICLRDVVMKVPELVRSGTTLQLACHYDLEGDSLYSIKFYQGDEEFYRYVPKEAPPTRVFPLPGVQVDVYQSNSTVVTLNNIKKEMSGQYKCEVSADAPLFHTIIKSARLQVIEKPRTLPEIHVEKTKYSVGEKIRANCTSRSSFPAANLTFYANGVALHNNDLSRLSWYVKSEGGGLESSLMELETIAVPGLFHDGRLRLRCVATQFHLYRQGADVWLQEDTPQLAHVLGSSSNHDFDSSCGRASLSWWLLLAVIGHASR